MDDTSALTLYKASAGSGKTFMLAARYIGMLVRDPRSYRSILAVTFTNKATAEMKQRILSQLYGIGAGLKESDAYFDKVKELLGNGFTDAQIRSNATAALEMILQDYGHFRVETIDSFFQTLMKGLARELQLGSNLTLELDTSYVIGEAVRSFLSGLKQGTEEMDNVLRFIQHNIDEENGWQIDKELSSFSEQLFKEEFTQNEHVIKLILQNPKVIHEYAGKLKASDGTENSKSRDVLVSCGNRICDMIGSIGSGLDDIKKKYAGIIRSLADGTFLEKAVSSKNNPAEKLPSGNESLFLKPSFKKYPGLDRFESDVLLPIFDEAARTVQEYAVHHNSVTAALSHLNELSLLLAIRNEIDRLNREKGRFVFADTANLLCCLTEGDTSFVYEKTGSYIRHMMIDEFQDTSRLQWKNLGILIHECLSQNDACIVVGDVKQSIYRWRNGDWNILNSEIERKFTAYNPKTVPLNTNRRSCSNVIGFNNMLFPAVRDSLCRRYREKFGQEFCTLDSAYKDVAQESTDNSPEGSISVKLVRDKDSVKDKPDFKMDLIEQELDRLLESGVHQGDIAMLLRTNDEITAIVNHFSVRRPDIRMVSSEAFQLDSSVSVRMIINAIRWISDDSDKVALASLLYDWNRTVQHNTIPFHTLMDADPEESLPGDIGSGRSRLRQMPLYELAEHLFIALGLQGCVPEDEYVFTLLDVIRNFTSSKSAEMTDFIEAWDDKLHKQHIGTQNSDSIVLMTIHKAKGLEFHSVIIPFCNWEFCSNGRKKNSMWISTDAEPFCELPLIPVDFSDDLKQSVFSDSYRDETGRIMVDNLNLLYVALTRARFNLSILSAKGPAKSGLSFNAGDLIAESLQDKADTHITDGLLTYENGIIKTHLQEKSERSDNPFVPEPSDADVRMVSFGLGATFKQSNESRRFVRSDDEEDRVTDSDAGYMEYGKLMHLIFSEISTADDVIPAVNRMLTSGIVGDRDEADRLGTRISKALKDVEGHGWFDGHWTLFRESALLFKQNGQLQKRRPDRVMTDGNETIVVDFKFAVPRDAHIHQVQEYMELLEQMGFPNVKGYVWYVLHNNIIDC